MKQKKKRKEEKQKKHKQKGELLLYFWIFKRKIIILKSYFAVLRMDEVEKERLKKEEVQKRSGNLL